MHSAESPQFTNPPVGYSYLFRPGQFEPAARALSRNRIAVGTNLTLNQIAPTALARAVAGKLAHPPYGSAFTYSMWHLVMRHEPWVMEIADINNFAFDKWQLKLLRSPIRNLLEKDNFKFLICWFESVQNDLRSYLQSGFIEDKLLLVPRAVPAKPIRKLHRNSDRVRFLFVGSSSQIGEFGSKGGPETLLAFKRLLRCFGNVELVVRSDVGSEVSELCRIIPNVTLISETLSRSALEELYRSSDVFVCPSHYAPWGTILEAMSYGLPVVTCDVFGMRDLVTHNVDGLLVQRFETLYDAKKANAAGLYNDYGRSVREIDRTVVSEVARYLSLLVSDAPLRMRLGRAARERTLSTNSFHRQRQILKATFDRIE